MLPELLQGTDVGGFIIIQDSTSYSGRNLLKSFINAALNREELVHVLGFEVSEEELKDGLNGSSMKRLHFHNAYVDPLGWTEHPPFTVHQFTSNELTNLLKQTLQPKPVTLVIDSLSWILRHSSPPAICSTLQQLKKDKNSNSPRAAIRDNVSGGSRLTQSHDHEKLLSDTPGGAVRTVVSLLHSDMHQRGMVGSVCHLATSVVTVTPGLRGDEAVAKTTRRSKSGKVMQDEEIFSIKDDLTVTIHSKPSHPGTKQTDPDEPEEDPTANLTFNLRLSDTERKAKEKLALPFVFSKEKKTALLHSGPGSGRILYEPDANDDYDQEDPDDDLDV